MMMNLFSIFDPTTSNWLSLNWSSIFIIPLLLPLMFWLNKNRLSSLFNSISMILMSELKNNSSKKNWILMPMMLSVFFFILMSNMMGLFPYTFTSTSHLMVSLSFGMPLWLAYMLFSWFHAFSLSSAHLVPMGSPMYLSFFMVLVETISLIIRPMTLGIRLTANMIAGHLLMSLLSSIPVTEILLFIPCYFILIPLILLEFAVSIIQSYVYFTLLTLYMNEIN